MLRSWISMMFRWKEVCFANDKYICILIVYVAPGRANYQLELTDDEPTSGIVRGTVSWLATGLRIQEQQQVAYIVGFRPLIISLFQISAAQPCSASRSTTNLGRTGTAARSETPPPFADRDLFEQGSDVPPSLGRP